MPLALWTKDAGNISNSSLCFSDHYIDRKNYGEHVTICEGEESTWDGQKQVYERVLTNGSVIQSKKENQIQITISAMEPMVGKHGEPQDIV